MVTLDEETVVHLPKLGESIHHATVVSWLKQVGDYVKRDEPLVEVMTDKVSSEIPAPAEGYLREIMVQIDEEVEVGKTLCLLSREGSPSAAVEKPAVEIKTLPLTRISPAVKHLLRRHGLKEDDLSRIPSTGDAGRVTKRDVEEYVKGMAKQSDNARAQTVSLSPLRKVIAKEMQASLQTIPAATLVDEVDVTPLCNLRQGAKGAFFAKHNVKLTMTAYLAKAMSLALKETPRLNATLEGTDLHIHPSIHLGIAVNVHDGVLVPVLTSADEKSVSQIAFDLARLTEKTRDGELLDDGRQRSTVTLTNFGMGGVAIGIPVIRPQEAAIIGIGAVSKKITVTAEQQFAIRDQVYISLSFDHRIVDGMYASSFFHKLKAIIADQEHFSL